MARMNIRAVLEQYGEQARQAAGSALEDKRAELKQNVIDKIHGTLRSG